MVPAHMHAFATILMILTATALTAAAAPRVAMVRVQDIYANLASTKALEQEIRTERDQIMKDRRAEELRRTISELQGLQTTLSGEDPQLDEAAIRKLARSFEIKRQEAQTLQKDFEAFRTEQEKQINRKMIAAMHASLEKIMETARKVASKEGYDLVFDSSGHTNTGVAFILYQKEPADLTDAVNAALNGPAGPQPAAEAAADAGSSPSKPATPTPR
jgi:Skp family chaperone for outer membrane proteins